MKRCRECGEITASSGNTCLSCGGQLYVLSKAECETFEKEKEYIARKIERREKIKKSMELISLGILAAIVIIGSVVVVMRYGFQVMLIPGFLLTIFGAFQILYPEGAWELQHFFSSILYDSISPSEFGLVMVKFGGYMMMVIAAIATVVLAI